MTELTAIYKIWHGESSLVAVANTEADADAEIQRLDAEGIQDEIDCSVDPEEEIEEWREQLKESGVDDALNNFPPPVDMLVSEARERAVARYRESCWYVKRPVRLV